MDKVEIAIIGTGPAGISAAINAKIRGKSFLLFGSRELSEKVQKSEKICNYPGFPSIGGRELADTFLHHLMAMEIPIIEEKITAIYKMSKSYSLFVNEKEYTADTIIMATGVETMKPIKGERELLGRGVSYCATCDGNLYKGKDIAIVCESQSMEEEVSYLAGLANKVYYFPLFKSSTLTGSNIEVLSEPIKELMGENRVTALKIGKCEETELSVDGIFFIKETVSPLILLKGLHTDNGHLAVDREMRTNLKGCFAAGDCTGRPYQITKAVGEGNIALHSAISYLTECKKVKQ